MQKYAADSGIALTDVRISNFRSLGDVEMELGDLTVLIGSNNAGKTSFLDALFAAVGSGRKALGQEDVRLMPNEAVAPKDRAVVIDCWRRTNFEPPCRSKFEPGLDAVRGTVVCG